MKTRQEQIEETMEMLLAHEPIIDVPYEQINDIAIALVQDGYGDIKQAKINVLNELKEKIQNAIDTYWNSNGGGYYLAEDAIDEIDEMIEEIKK